MGQQEQIKKEVEKKDAMDIPILNFALDIAIAAPQLTEFTKFLGQEAVKDVKPSCEEIATQLLEPIDKA